MDWETLDTYLLLHKVVSFSYAPFREFGEIRFEYPEYEMAVSRLSASFRSLRPRRYQDPKATPKDAASISATATATIAMAFMKPNG